MAGALRSRLTARLVVWLLLLAMAPWPVPVHYAHQAYLIREVGAVPTSFEFMAFDADSGVFLYGLAKRMCREFLPSSMESGEAVVARPHSWSAYETWDAGPGPGVQTMDRLRSQANELYGRECKDQRTGSFDCCGDGWDPELVLAEAGHFPQVRTAVPMSRFGYSVQIPTASLGPSQWVEHRVVTIGDPFEVRVWSGVGEKSWSCGSVLPAGTHIDGHFYRNDPGSDSRIMLLCVSYRYVGGDLGGAQSAAAPVVAL